MAKTSRRLPVLLCFWLLAAPAWAATLRIYSPEPNRFDKFGAALAADGGVAVVGVPLSDLPENSGSLWVLDGLAGPGWPAFGPFRSPTVAAQQIFGQKVALSGGHLLVATSQNLFHLMRDPLEPSSWVHQPPIDPAPAPFTLNSFAVSGDDLAVGLSEGACGAVAVYRFDQGWKLDTTLFPDACPPGEPDQYAFGVEVDLAGDTIAVGTLGGVAHLFRRVAGEWQADGKIEPSPEKGDDFRYFGRHLKVDGDRLLAASPQPVTGSGLPGNRAYIYERTGAGQWTRAATLIAALPAPITEHGTGLALQGDYAAIGSPRVPFGASGFPETFGAVYLFERQSDGTWPQVRRDAGWNSTDFGATLDLDGGRLWVGSPREMLPWECCYGAVYVIDVASPVFTDGFETGDFAAWSAVLP